MTDIVEFKNTVALHINQNKLVDDVIKNTISKEEEKQICKNNLIFRK